MAGKAERQVIGERVALQREAANLSRERLAAIAGVSAVTVYNVEHGKNSRFDTLEKIADALDMLVADLVA